MSFEQMMQELTQEYLEALPAKIADIENHFRQMDISVLREDFHKLKGTGSTYGIPEISLIGEAVEDICMGQPHRLSEVVPEAIEILREIHLARSFRKIAVNLESDPRFTRMTANRSE